MSEPTLPEKIVSIHGRLAASRIAHAFGGALALAYYAEPRATIDIDLNVFLAARRFEIVRDALRPLGVGGDVDVAAVQKAGQGRLWWSQTPIDLFFAYDALHDAMREDVRTVPFGEGKLPILAPEHLVVCKVVFDRPKDWLDIEQVLVCVEDLDTDEIVYWLARIVGSEDERTRRFDTAKELLGD